MNPKQPKNKTLESDIQARIIARLKAEGWLCVKLVSTNLPGIPDLLMLKDGKARFIEVKRPGTSPNRCKRTVLPSFERLASKSKY